MFPPVLVHQTPQAPLSAKDFQAKCGEFSKAKDWKGLEGLARTQIAADPKDAPAEAALGFALFAQNRADEGKAACEEALRLSPTFVQPLFYLGLQSVSEGDQKGVKVIGKRLESIAPRAAITFWSLPSVLSLITGDARTAVVKGESVHFKSMSLQSVFDMVGPIEGPIAVALVVDEKGFPTSAETLTSAPGNLRGALERAAMRWRIEPALINGKPSPVQFLKVINIETTTTTETITMRPRR
jgi:hypothetical protein